MPDWLEARRSARRYPLGFGTAGLPISEWQERVRAAWDAAVPHHGDLPDVAEDGDRLTFRFATGGTAEGRLRLPPGTAPVPAVLLLHDHGGRFDRGWRKAFADTADRESLTRHFWGQAPGDLLLAHGFAVLAVDAFGWGGREAGGYEGQQALAANAMQLGLTLAGIVAAEDAQAARWLARQPRVSAVGVFGFSFGGFRAWQALALAPEVRAAASLSWMARRSGLLSPGSPLLRGASAFWMLHPTLAALMDLPDMAGAGAGKPLFLRSGDQDPHMPPVAVAGAYADLAAMWRAAGAEPPDARLFAGGHVCPPQVQEEAVAFLRRALS